MTLPEDFRDKALALLQDNPEKGFSCRTIMQRVTGCDSEEFTDADLIKAERSLGYLKQQRSIVLIHHANGTSAWRLRPKPSASQPPPPHPTPLGAPTRYPSWLSVSNGWIYTICDDGTIWRTSEAEPDAWHALPGVPQP